MIIINMARKPRPPDPDYLEGIANGLKSLKEKLARESQGKVTDAVLASQLGIDTTTLSKYLNKKNAMSGEVVARACVDLGMEFRYKGRLINATNFPQAVQLAPLPPDQLSFAFVADYPWSGDLMDNQAGSGRAHGVLAHNKSRRLVLLRTCRHPAQQCRHATSTPAT